MKSIYKLLAVLASAGFFIASAQAQNAGTVTANAFAIGKGAGTQGYGSLLCASAQLAVGQSAAAPLCKTITGDVTLSAAGAITLGTVNSNVGTFGSATQAGQFTVNAKGLITAASNVAITLAIGSITGLGTGCATFLATPSSANLAACLTDETGSGAVVFGTSPTITGGSITALTALGIRSTGAAFDVRFASSEVLTANRTLSYVMGDAARTIDLTGGSFTINAGSGFSVTSGATGTWPVWTAGTLSGSSSATRANAAAPSTPSSGNVAIWTDSTDLRFHDKNSAGTIGTTVVADTGASNNFLTAISAAGVISKAQPAFINISGSVAASQMPALTGDVTTSAGAVATTIAANAVTNAKAAQMAAYTIKGNATGSTANATDISIPALTQKVSPAGADFIMIADSAASNALKYATVSSIASAGSVSSIAGNTGAFTLSHGLTNSTNDIQIDLATHRGYLSGLTLSTAGSSSTFGIAVGVAVDGAQTDFMKLTSAYTKTTSAWAVGSTNGALDTGAIANSTWYHVYLIKRTDTGVVDVLISLSASSPTLPTNYTLSRRIGSMLTNGSAQWVQFSQNGDEFLWVTAVNDVAGVTINSTTPSLRTLSVPPGVKVNVFGIIQVTEGASVNAVQIYSPDGGSNVASGLGFIAAASASASTAFSARTNTSQQVNTVGVNTNACTIYILTQGWNDRRGRDG